MLTTRAGDDLRARPMSAYAEQIENAIYFLTDVASHKADDIAKSPHVCLASAGAKAKIRLRVGIAAVENDREKIKELWATPAKAWWESLDDPPIPILKVTPSFAEYWESTGTIISYIKMAAAAMSSAKPDMGENEKVEM